MAVVSNQPWWQYCTDPAWDFPLNTDLGPDNLVTSNVNLSSFWLVFRTSQGVDSRGTGTFSVKQTSPAEVIYQESDADVAATFNGKLFVKALTTETPPRTLTWDPYDFIISPS